MIITQDFEIQGSQQEVWDLFMNAEQVAACMPGVEEVEKIGDKTYQAKMCVSIGPIKASFTGELKYADTQPIERIGVDSAWKEEVTSSKVDARIDIQLQDIGGGQVKIQVTVDAAILGTLGKYGQGVAEKKASEITKVFAAYVSDLLEKGELIAGEAGKAAAVSSRFAYHRPTTVEEAVQLLLEYGDEVKVMAGGQSLILLMREGLVKPGAIINLIDIPGLDQIEKTPSNVGIEVGALTTHRQLETSALVQKEIPLISATYQRLGNVQIRNMGTLGGNLCHNAPGSDPPPLLIALDATVDLTGAKGVRSLGVEEFGTYFYETALKPSEILTKVRIPLLPPRCGIAYQKYAARPMDMTVVGVAAKLVLAEDGKTIQDVRIALGGVAPTTIRARGAEDMLRGQTYSENLAAKSAVAAVSEIDPISDIHGSAEYRRELTPIGIRRMLALAWQQAQTGQRQGI